MQRSGNRGRNRDRHDAVVASPEVALLNPQVNALRRTAGLAPASCICCSAVGRCRARYASLTLALSGYTPAAVAIRQDCSAHTAGADGVYGPTPAVSWSGLSRSLPA